MDISKKLGRLKSLPILVTPSQPKSFLKVRSEDVEVVPTNYPGENLDTDQLPKEDSLKLLQQLTHPMENPTEQIKKGKKTVV
eukprot:11917314-Ditylum_brightwellii.AAC.1